jgi:hypothetical protein
MPYDLIHPPCRTLCLLRLSCDCRDIPLRNRLHVQDLALHYPQVFKTRVPACVVLKCQYDWVKYYKSVTNPISGFTKTAADPHTVQGWQLAKGKTGLVELRWQPVASLTARWLGQDGTPLSMGFVKLRGRPMVS